MTLSPSITSILICMSARIPTAAAHVHISDEQNQRHRRRQPAFPPDNQRSLNQDAYNNLSEEYCYNESTNLGICLGKQQLANPELVTLDTITKCLECSGNIDGDETCDDLKRGKEVIGLVEGIEEVDGESEGNGGNGENTDTIFSGGLCQTYNACVELNCPQECWKEQDLWLECMVIELDCDWRCSAAGEPLGVGGRMYNIDFATNGASNSLALDGGMTMLVFYVARLVFFL